MREFFSLPARGMTHLLPADRRMDGDKEGGDGRRGDGAGEGGGGKRDGKRRQGTRARGGLKKTE